MTYEDAARQRDAWMLTHPMEDLCDFVMESMLAARLPDCDVSLDLGRGVLTARWTPDGEASS